MVRGRLVTAPEARAYKSNAQLRALAFGLRPLEGDISFSMNVFRPRRSGDLDNYLKLVWDALTGVGWKDDAQVAELHAYRFEDKADPRVEITLKRKGDLSE